MQVSIDQKIIDMGIILPEPVKPAAHYLPVKQDGGLLYISGQLPWGTDGIITGKLTDNNEEQLKIARNAAKLCGLHILAQAKKVLGSLDKVNSIIRVTGYINCSDGCTEIPFILDGISDLFIKIFGTTGYHARSAVGCSSLPFSAITEVEAILSGGWLEGNYSPLNDKENIERKYRRHILDEDIAPGG